VDPPKTPKHANEEGLHRVVGDGKFGALSNRNEFMMACLMLLFLAFIGVFSGYHFRSIRLRPVGSNAAGDGIDLGGEIVIRNARRGILG